MKQDRIIGLTPQAPDIVPKPADDVEHVEAGAPEITNEMIEAAARILWASGVIPYPIEADRVAVKRALVAALAVASA